MKGAKVRHNEIQKNESFVKKYKSLDNAQAKKDGYKINKEDLEDVNLKKIAGGGSSTTFKMTNQKASVNVLAAGDNSSARNESTIIMNGLS